QRYRRRRGFDHQTTAGLLVLGLDFVADVLRPNVGARVDDLLQEVIGVLAVRSGQVRSDGVALVKKLVTVYVGLLEEFFALGPIAFGVASDNAGGPEDQFELVDPVALFLGR